MIAVRRGDDDAHGREHGHRRRQRDDLADGLLRCERPKRVKSGMLSDSVAQKPIIAVSDGTKTLKNAPKSWNLPGCAMIAPRPCARQTAHADEQRGHHEHERRGPVLDLAQEIHAAVDDEDVEPPEEREADPLGGGVAADEPAAIDDRRPEHARPGHSASKNVCSAWPPIQQLMPNQPHATSARMSAGTFAPKMP